MNLGKQQLDLQKNNTTYFVTSVLGTRDTKLLIYLTI